MQLLRRSLSDRLISKMRPGKVVVIYGPRRAGKSIFLKQLLKDLKLPYLLLNGEDINTVELLARRSVENYRNVLGDKRLLVIDEAQKVPGIGPALKLMVDEIEDLQVIVTGSSAFDLTGTLGEPLTGRKIEFMMLPFSQQELSAIENPTLTREHLYERMVFGSYPEVVKATHYEDKAEYLRELMNSYLLKDILESETVRNSSKLFQLLRLIAFQVGKEVSLDELGKESGMSKNTIDRYLHILSNTFVLFKLSGFARNMRSEITKMNKWYFYDNGIRNALIANFHPLHLRSDTGELWDNYLITERIKMQKITGMASNNHFWRTYQQQEIDWVEQRDGKLYAFEFKWNPNQKTKVPTGWKNNYPEAGFEVITKDNYLKWILPGKT